MSKKLFVLVVGTLLVSVTASANLVPVGDPIEGGSWSQAFVEDLGTYDLIGVKMISTGDTFETPTFFGFDQPWVLSYENAPQYPTVASASGPVADAGVNMLDFSINFAGTSSEALVFDFVSFLGDQVNNLARATWSGSSWSFLQTADGTWANPPAYTRDDFVAVPAPGAALLGVIGLGTIGWVRRRWS